MDEPQNIFNAYKPLRNHLQKACLEDSFYVLWAFCNAMQMKNRIPDDIEVHPDARIGGKPQERVCHEWDIEILARESIINCPDLSGCSKSFKTWNYFAGALKKLRDIEEEIARSSIQTENVIWELFRVSHRQFPWQGSPSANDIMRYYTIYSVAPMATVIEKHVGMSVVDLFATGTALLGLYLKSPAARLPITVKITHLDEQKMERFLALFALPIDRMREEISEERRLDDSFFYYNTSLRKYPVIQMRYRGVDSLVCPLPSLLFWRYTTGLYYELCDKPGFSNAYGSSFQKYVGEVLKRANKAQRFRVLQEEEYRPKKAERKDTSDWIVADESALLFTECKTKRLRLNSKVNLGLTESLQSDIDSIAQAAVQLYKTIDDHRNNLYPSLPHDPKKKIYPLIVTLENWYGFGPNFNEVLQDTIRAKLRERNMGEKFVEDFPCTICSASDFEILACILSVARIEDILRDKVAKEKFRMWNIGAYLNEKFSKEVRENYQPYFRDEWNSLFDEFKK